MIRPKAVYPLWAVALITALLIIPMGCTKKNNLTGDNWSDVQPQIAIDTTFTIAYSYTHTGKVAGSERVLPVGIQDGIESVAVMQFTGLADSITVSGQPTLKLVAFRRSALRRDPLVLSLHKLNTDWSADSTSLILDTDLSEASFATFTVQDALDSAGDTLTINIPIATVQDWVTEDVTGLNIAIKATGGWVEFKSRESSYGATLTFNYREPGDTADSEYSQKTVKDSYRVTGTQAALSDNLWKLKNLNPQRMFVQFGLPSTLFRDSDDIALSAVDLKRMAVNKAELVLFVKNNPYYSAVSAGFFPYVLKDTLSVPRALTDDDLLNNSYSLSSSTIVDDDSVRIDITAIIHSFTSGAKPNYGIIIKSLQEMTNFGSLEFWDFDTAPAGKKPYVRVIYTPPYLKAK